MGYLLWKRKDNHAKKQCLQNQPKSEYIFFTWNLMMYLCDDSIEIRGMKDRTNGAVRNDIPSLGMRHEADDNLVSTACDDRLFVLVLPFLFTSICIAHVLLFVQTSHLSLLWLEIYHEDVMCESSFQQSLSLTLKERNMKREVKGSLRTFTLYAKQGVLWEETLWVTMKMQ